MARSPRTRAGERTRAPPRRAPASTDASIARSCSEIVDRAIGGRSAARGARRAHEVQLTNADGVRPVPVASVRADLRVHVEVGRGVSVHLRVRRRITGTPANVRAGDEASALHLVRAAFAYVDLPL